MTRHRTFEELGAPLPAPEFRAATDAIVANIEQVIEGKTATVRLALAVMLAEGHLLIEDVLLSMYVLTAALTLPCATDRGCRPEDDDRPCSVGRSDGCHTRHRRTHLQHADSA